MSINEYIRTKAIQYRNCRGLTQELLADNMGVHSSFISQLESGRKKYSLKHINQMARIFNISPKEFLPDQFIEE